LRLDLHTHSTASDGSLTPREIVRLASDMGLEAIALTDHDSVEGVQPARDAASGLDLLVIPGVELSSVHEGLDVHVLGYFVDIADAAFLEHLEQLRSARLRRAQTMVRILGDAGFHVTIDDVLLLAEGGSVGRSHIARALVNRGHADSVAEAFERFIGRGRPYYVPKDSATPAEAVGIILEADGLPVLAHPGVTGVEDLIPELVADGLAGVEAYHAEHTLEQAAAFADLARRHGLIVTGGSDHHGPLSPGASLGTVELPDDTLAKLLAAAGLTADELRSA